MSTPPHTQYPANQYKSKEPSAQQSPNVDGPWSASEPRKDEEPNDEARDDGFEELTDVEYGAAHEAVANGLQQ